MTDVVMSAALPAEVDTCVSSVVPQVEVVFETDIKDERFRSAHLSSGLLVPASLGRRGLSQIVNHLLELPEPTPFDFFVRVLTSTAGHDDGRQDADEARVFLRSSLSKFMAREGLTSETRLVLIYVLARSTFESDIATTLDDWTLGLSSVMLPTQHMAGIVAAASADGHCQFYRALMRSDGPALVSNENMFRCKMSQTSLSSVSLHVHPENTEAIQFVASDTMGTAHFGAIRVLEERCDVTPLCTGKCDYGSLTASAISSDGASAATSASNGTVLLWDNNFVQELINENVGERSISDNMLQSKKRPRESPLPSARLQGSLYGHTSGVNDICFPRGNLWKFCLVSGSSDQTLRLWDIPSLTALATWPVVRCVTSVTSSPTSYSLATGHEDGRVRVWDVRCASSGLTMDALGSSLQQCSMRSTYNIHRRLISQVKWNPDDANVLVSVSHDGNIKIIDLRSPRFALQTVSYPSVKVLCVEWLDEHHFVSGGSDHCIRTHFTS